MQPWVILVGLLAVIGWGVVAGMWLEPRLLPRLLRASGGQWPRAVLVGVGSQLAAAAGTLVWAGIGYRTGSRPVAAVLVAPVLLAYAPYLLMAMPTEANGFGYTRADLRKAGASRAVSRALAWSHGLTAMLVGFASWFVAASLLWHTGD